MTSRFPDLSVAVVTLTRDRLDYTKHCFAKLREFAGCEFDHFVLDQGSNDGTQDWLREYLRDPDRDPDGDIVVGFSPRNIGISRGMNRLLRHVDEYVRASGDDRYDVIVKFDNDCELTQPNTLRDIARLVHESDCLLSPRILGLNNPPAPQGTFMIGEEEILDIPQIGGIFLAAPARIYNNFRYDTAPHVANNDDVQLCWWWRGQGGRCGYVKRLEAWHYETTSGQHQRFPAYYQRQQQERRDASDHRAVRA